MSAAATPSQFYFDLCNKIAIVDGSVVDREANTILHSSPHQHSLRLWLSEYVYYRFYADDKSALERLVSKNKPIGTIMDIEEANIVRRVVRGCDHTYFNDESWSVASGGPRYINGQECIPVTNGMVAAYCSRDRCTLDHGKLTVIANAIQRFLTPGWVYIIGEYGGSAIKDESGIRRHYHSIPEGDDIESIVHAITGTLNSEKKWYRLKVANNQSGLMRNDAIVVYTQDEVSESILQFMSKGFHRSYNQSRVPPMTKRLDFGWSKAPEIGTHNACLSGSYGQICCTIIAEGLIRAHGNNVNEAYKSVKDSFRSFGFDPDCPFEGVEEHA